MKKNHWQGWTVEKLRELRDQGKITFVDDLPGAKAPVKKKNKYNANPREVDGIVFDSKKEANRYKELLMLLKAGEISMPKLQVEFQLNGDGEFSYKYIADFVYTTKEGVRVVEDAKGFRTKEYKRKRRLMKKIHGIDIHEI